LLQGTLSELIEEDAPPVDVQDSMAASRLVLYFVFQPIYFFW